MVPKPTYIYHITHIRNLRSILNNDGLLSYAGIHDQNANYTNLAHETIQNARAATKVPLSPGGTLHEYVPFYFAPRSPMLYTIDRGNVAGYTEGQQPVIYLVSSVEQVQEANLEFVFTDGHGIIKFSNFFNDTQQLDQIDWGVMQSRMWNDTIEDPDRKRRRQAEFLVKGRIPWAVFRGIGTFNREYSQQVRALLGEYGKTTPVATKRHWYY